MTETDRELLEMAAKAIGASLKHMEVKNVNFKGDDRFIGFLAEVEKCPRGWFSPLTDDGDALRLAVQLGIESRKPSRARSVGTVVQAWYPPDGNPNRSACAHVSEHVRNGDRLEATRRAIVRAAAEIGRAMP